MQEVVQPAIMNEVMRSRTRKPKQARKQFSVELTKKPNIKNEHKRRDPTVLSKSTISAPKSKH